MTALTHHLNVWTFHTRFRFRMIITRTRTNSVVSNLTWGTDGVITKTTTPIVNTTKEIVANANALMQNTSAEYKDMLALNQMPAPMNTKVIQTAILPTRIRVRTFGSYSWLKGQHQGNVWFIVWITIRSGYSTEQC